MSTVLRPTRSSAPVDEDLIFFAMPYGKKPLRRGDSQEHDFNDLYDYQLKPALVERGLKPFRADETSGLSLVLESVWDGIDRAGIVVVDFSAASESVALEAGWAMCLHKRMIILAQSESDIPTDLRGLRFVKYEFTARGFRMLVDRLLLEIDLLRHQPLREMDLKPRNPLTATLAEVEAVFDDRVRVRDVSRNERSAELFRSDVSYMEVLPEQGIPKGRKFQVGGRLRGAFLVRDDVYIFSQKEIEDDPWGAWEQEYPRHSTVTARVTDVKGSVAFIELPGGGKSRIRVNQGEDLQRDHEVAVVITSVDRALHRIDVERMDPALSAPESRAYPPVGECQVAIVHDIRIDSGFLRVNLDSYPDLTRPAILHISKMTDGLRRRFEAGHVLEGDRLIVQVTDVATDPKQPWRLKVGVRDLASAESIDDELAASSN